MSSARNLRRVVVGLFGLLGLAGVGVWLARMGRPPAEPVAREQMGTPVNKELRMVRKGQLQPGEDGGRRDLAFQEGEGGHQFDISLQMGQFLHVVVEQKGVDVDVILFRPGGERRVGVDSPNGSEGPETVFDVAEQTGFYRLDVVPADTVAPNGKYDVRVEAIRLAQEKDHQHVEAWRTFRKGEKLRRNDSRLDALTAYNQALEEWRKLGNPEWEAEAQYRIGWMYQELREVDRALPALRAALPFFRNAGRRHDEADLHNRIGDCLYRKSELAQAITEHENALEIARSVGDRSLEADALIGLGNAQNVLGETRNALSRFQDAVTAARVAGDSDQEKRALFGLGNTLVYQGKLPEARDTLNQALQIQRLKGMDREGGNILRRLADIDLREERYGDAFQRLEQALALARESEDQRIEAVTLNSLGTVQLLSGATEPAGNSYRRALEIFRSLRNPHGEAFALLNLGRYDHRRQSYQGALESYDQAITIFREINNRRGEVSSSFGAAQVLHDTKNFREADERLRSVIRLVESLRLESDSQDLRASFLATKQHYHELQIDVLMHLHESDSNAGYDIRALEANETRRARSLLELLAEPRLRGSLGAAESELLESEQKLLQQVQATERELLMARERDDQEIATLAVLQRSLLSDLDTVQTRLRESGSAQLAIIYPHPLELAEMSQTLDDNTLLIVYALGEERSFVWCISRQGLVVSKILPRRSLLEGTARELLDAWSRRETAIPHRARHWAERLGEDLFKPIASEFVDKRLVFVGDGLLQSLPFAALPDPMGEARPDGPSSPLAVRHEVVQLPSISVLAALRRKMRERKGSPQSWAAVIADPVFGGNDDDRLAAIPLARRPTKVQIPQGSDLERTARSLGINFKRLRFTAREAEVILSLLGEDQVLPLLGFEASRQKLRQVDLQDYRILHFATHGLVDPEHSEVAGLVLSLLDENGGQQEGFLLAQEIGNLEVGAELVVLSACSTGLGKEIRGEGPLNLTRSFFCAGAPRVVVSLWNVNDAGTAELMERFYRLMIEEGFPPAAALRCAQVSMLNSSWNDPYIWAPFIFQGDWQDKVRSGDGSIEKRKPAVGMGDDSDDSLPDDPDDVKPPMRCPDLI